MFVRILFATLHLLGLGIGLGAIYARGRGLRGPFDEERLGRIFLADTFWAVAAGLWIITGLIRAFSGLEKGSAYYLSNTYFLIKMALLAVIILLEIWPMITLIHWRGRVRRGEMPDTTAAPTMATISWVQAGLVILMVFAATAMARGFGI
jgi:putative membrane protein